MKNQKKIFHIIGVLSVLAAVVMFGVGSSNPNLTELVDFFWIPLVLGVVSFLVSGQSKE